MSVINRSVKISDTDCTGRLYFTNIFRFSQEGFEELIKDGENSINNFIFIQKIEMPIVNAQANFIRPIYLGDDLILKYTLEFKNTSFKVFTDFFVGNEKKGEVEITHVCVDSKSQEKIMSKELFRDLWVS